MNEDLNTVVAIQEKECTSWMIEIQELRGKALQKGLATWRGKPLTFS